VFRTFFRGDAEGHCRVPAGEELWKLFLVIGLNKIRAVVAHHKAARRDVRATAAAGEYAKAVDSLTAADDQALHALQLTIDELLDPSPPSHRQIVELRVAGYEVAEAAQATGRAKRSVERILQEFRQVLRDHIGDRA
jgi:DNA-directed RNA polymerase specialized sigma24 family protein